MIVPLPFAPRPWQTPLLDDPASRIVAVVHRRAGKSTGLMWRGLRKGLTWKRQSLVGRANPNWPGTRWTRESVARSLSTDPVRVIHTLPYQVQWDRTGLWDRLARAASKIDGARVLKSDMRIMLPGGGVYQAGGMDKPDSWRGGYADEVILDEYDDTQAEGQVTAIEPMLADFDGTLLRSGTPKGYNRLKDAYAKAGSTEGHSRYLLTYRDTNALSPEAIARMREEMTEEEFAQELECSFDAPHSGAYYAKLMQQADSQGRIGVVPYEPRLPVWTGWDLGMDDSTAIWFAQVAPGGDWRIIDYLEGSGEVLGHYAGLIKERGYNVYERHLLPHDAAVRDLGAVQATTREATLNSLGVRPTKILPRTGPADRVNAVRLILPKARFNAAACAAGIKALWHYKREFNDDANTFKATPVHDWSSHAADAFGHLAQGARERVERTRLPSTVAAWNPYGEAA